jgi:integrase
VDKATVQNALDVLAAALGQRPDVGGPTLDELWQRYFREDARKLDTAGDIARIGKRLSKAWGARPVASLTSEDAEAYRDQRAATLTRLKDRNGNPKPTSPQTIDNELSVARRFLNWCVDEKLLAHNGLARVKLARPNNARKTKVKTEADLQKLLDQCDPMLEALVLLLIDCGPRRMEAIGMEWVQLEIRADRAVVELWDTKNEKRRHIRLSLRTLAALLRLPRAGRFVFENPKTKHHYHPRHLYRRFLRAVEAAGLVAVGDERICFHTLRHSFAYLRRTRDKVSRQAIMKQGGWVDPKVFDRYGIPDDDELDDMYVQVDKNIAAEMALLRKGPRRSPEHTDTYTDTHVGQTVKGQVRK